MGFWDVVSGLAAGSQNDMVSSLGKSLMQRQRDEEDFNRQAADARAKFALEAVQRGGIDPTQAEGLLRGSPLEGIPVSGITPEAQQGRDLAMERAKLEAWLRPGPSSMPPDGMGPPAPGQSMADLEFAAKLPELTQRQNMELDLVRQKLGMQGEQDLLAHKRMVGREGADRAFRLRLMQMQDSMERQRAFEQFMREVAARGMNREDQQDFSTEQGRQRGLQRVIQDNLGLFLSRGFEDAPPEAKIMEIQQLLGNFGGGTQPAVQPLNARQIQLPPEAAGMTPEELQRYMAARR